MLGLCNQKELPWMKKYQEKTSEKKTKPNIQARFLNAVKYFLDCHIN